jgi:glycosyltransferase involved in cell wall biosynthesis
MADPPARILFVDENVRGSGGHYLELATLLMDGAREFGYVPTLAASDSFAPDELSDLANDSRVDETYSCLRTRRMNFWSLGVDGNSRVQRNVDGDAIGSDRLAKCWHRARDPLSRRQRNPQRMVRQWSEDFQRLLEQWLPTKDDQIVVNTADDFVLLGLANALQQYGTGQPLDIKALFHFAVFESNNITRRARAFGRQVNAAVAASRPHRVSLFATTESLAEQLAAVGVDVKPVPYPTRWREPETQRSEEPLKILMAGMPRAEKGRDHVPKLLASICEPFLSRGQFQVSLQVRPKDWKRMIPRELHEAYRASVQADSMVNDRLAANASMGASPLEIVSSDLPGEEYHRWLGTADVGLFLYDPVRYVARCSGVLLEMMVAGVPIVVPANCWLDDQLELAGGDGSVGFRYQSIDQIPALLKRIRGDYAGLQKRASRYANVMAMRHTGANTLAPMGIRPVGTDSPQTYRRLAS